MEQFFLFSQNFLSVPRTYLFIFLNCSYSNFTKTVQAGFLHFCPRYTLKTTLPISNMFFFEEGFKILLNTRETTNLASITKTYKYIY